MKYFHSLGLLIGLLVFVKPVSACECSAADAQAAEQSSATLDSWESIYAAQKRFSHCDDGAIAEGFSESVVHLLATRWSLLAEAQRLFTKDSSFQQFVLRHIDASADSAELDQIVALAKQHCPVSDKLLCNQILEAALDQ
jgi:hypothetical protein